MDFFTLYEACRDEMIVNTDQALKNLLRELKDHEIVIIKKGNNNKEYLHLNLTEGIIATLL